MMSRPITHVRLIVEHGQPAAVVGEAAPPVGQDHVHAPVPGLVAQSEANAGKV